MKLLAEVSGHGFGHLAQSAEVLNRFCTMQPETELLVRTTSAAAVVRSRFDVPFTLIQGSSDYGMIMHSALEVDIGASAAVYREYHQNWQQNIEQLADWLTENSIEAVFSNISYAILAAAKQAGLPSIALCSLNWAEIYRAYCAELDGAEPILAQMRAAYNNAEYFICPTPSMPMPGLHNLQVVGPIARPGINRRTEILQKLARDESTRLVLVTPGGIPTDMAVTAWPKRDDVIWMVTWPTEVQREDVISREALGMHFSDLLMSSDVVLTKPGYGMVAETACAAKPVIMTCRGDWPEEPCLMQWLKSRTSVVEVTRRQFLYADVLNEIDQLCQLPSPNPVVATGAEEAAIIMSGCF